jgi:hypothetical protein
MGMNWKSSYTFLMLGLSQHRLQSVLDIGGLVRGFKTDPDRDLGRFADNAMQKDGLASGKPSEFGAQMSEVW